MQFDYRPAILLVAAVFLMVILGLAVIGLLGICLDEADTQEFQ